MEYLSALDVARKWGISKRRVQILCIENRMRSISKMITQNKSNLRMEAPVDFKSLTRQR